MMTRRLFSTLGLGAAASGMLASLGCGRGGAHVPVEASRIMSVRVTSGGGMTGGGESAELHREEGRVVLSTRSREWHDSRETGMDYVLSEDAFERMAQIAGEYGLAEAATRKQSPYVVLDAPTSRLSFSVMDESGMYNPDASFAISSEQELTERDREGWRAVETALAEMAAGAEGVPYEEPLTLTLVTSGVQYHFTLNDSTAARDLAARCPLDVSIEDYGENEKVFYLDDPLDASDTPLASGAAGSVCYFAPWGDVVFFYKDGAPYEGLYELGFIENDFEITFLADIEPGKASLWSNYTEE